MNEGGRENGVRSERGRKGEKDTEREYIGIFRTLFELRLVLCIHVHFWGYN